MKRLHKIKKEQINDQSTNNGQIANNSTVNGNGTVNNQQVAEEKAAARLFPLNLISNRFKNAQPDVLSGKILYEFINFTYLPCL